MTSKSKLPTYKERIESKSQQWSRLFAKSFLDRGSETPNKSGLLSNEIFMLDYLTEGARMNQWENFKANLHSFKKIQKKLPKDVANLTEGQIKQLYSYIIINRIFDDYDVFDETGQVPQKSEDVVSFILAVSAYRSVLKEAVEGLKEDKEGNNERIPNFQKLEPEVQKKLDKVHDWLIDSQTKPRTNRFPLKAIALAYFHGTNTKEIKTPAKKEWNKIALSYGYQSPSSGHNIYGYFCKYSHRTTNRILPSENRNTDKAQYKKLKSTVELLNDYPIARAIAEKKFEFFKDECSIHYGDRFWEENND